MFLDRLEVSCYAPIGPGDGAVFSRWLREGRVVGVA